MILAIVMAASCNTADVQLAMDTAEMNDSVYVPLGTCVWDHGVTAHKDLDLIGDHTTIMFRGTAFKDTAPGINLGLTTGTVRGFNFIMTDGADFAIRADGEGWRITGNEFTNQTVYPNRYAVFSRAPECDPPGGLVDHNVFVNSRVVAHGTLRVACQHFLWSESLKLGADQGYAGVVYIEDNMFTRTIYADAADTEYAGRYVFRYNTVINGTAEAHPIFLAQRAPRAWEVYNNTFICSFVRVSCDAAIWPRSGTGVVFNNTVLGYYVYPIKLDNRRSFDGTLSNPPGVCNGQSPWDGNDDNGYPCRDQIGRGQDMRPYSGTGALPDQFQIPAHFWNNTFKGAPINPHVANCSSVVKANGSCTDILEGRDFINEPKPGYKPYVYPHPLNIP